MVFYQIGKMKKWITYLEGNLHDGINMTEWKWLKFGDQKNSHQQTLTSVWLSPDLSSSCKHDLLAVSALALQGCFMSNNFDISFLFLYDCMLGAIACS